VLDEPTVFLPRDGVEKLFRLMRELAASGAGVLFVSHDLDEVRDVTDRVTVFRDGSSIGTTNTADTDEQQLVEMIIGRELSGVTGHAITAVRDRPGPATVVKQLSGGALHDVSFQIGKGEVLGLAGLAGSGFEDVPYLLFGAREAHTGTIALADQTLLLSKMTPRSAVDAGLALIPADRKAAGSVASLSVADNVSMQVASRYFRRGVFHRRELNADVAATLRKFDVRPSDPTALYGALSGGNQQKVMLAKWLQTDPSLLLLHEPTQGVDVGAREEILGIVRGLAEAGTTVLCSSSDHEQLALICDRVLVFSRGEIVGELVGEDVRKEQITERCLASYQTQSITYAGSTR
jgi:ribose transport system ATP-binding protein